MWGFVNFNLSMLLENVKSWPLVSKVIKIDTPNYISP